MPDEFEHFDASYVLGSLSAVDRVRFETHLAQCDDCQARVDELSGLLPLLDLAVTTEAAEHQDIVPVPATLLPRLLNSTSTTRRSRRRAAGRGVLALAACLALLAAFTLTRGNSDPYGVPSQARALVNVTGAPIDARVQVVTTDSWAQINLWCTYTSPTFQQGNYRAVAVDKSGRTAVIGTWPSLPGQTTVLRTPTQFHTTELSRIEIVGPGGEQVAQLTV